MIEKFKQLPTGTKRLIIIGCIPGALILGAITGSLIERRLYDETFWLYSIFLGLPLYWASVLAGVWINEGFKEK